MGIPSLHLALALPLLLSLAFTDGVSRTFPEGGTLGSLVIDKSATQDTSGFLNSVSLRFKDGIQFKSSSIPSNYLLFESGPSATDNVVLYHNGKRVSYIVKRNTAQAMPYTGSVSMDTSKEWHTVSLLFDNVKAILEVDGASHYNFMGYLPKIADKVYLYKLQPITSLDIIISPFVGCLDNFSLNGANLQVTGNLFDAFAEGCSFPFSLVSFSGAESFLNYTIDPAQNVSKVAIDMKLRTFNVPSTIALFTLDPAQEIRVALSGIKDVQVTVGAVTINYTTNQNLKLDDGNYHQLRVTIDLAGEISLVVDMDINMTTTAASPLFTPLPDSKYVNMEIGSSAVGPNGFRGCVSGFRSSLMGADTVNIDLSHVNGNQVEMGSCGFIDRCLYGVCANSLPCTQTEDSYRCMCGSGWEGYACNTPKTTLESCRESAGRDRTIDTDGAGPLIGFVVDCVQIVNDVWTQISATNAADVTISEADYPYTSTLEYGATLGQIRSLIDRNAECRQNVEYTCIDSKLFTKMHIANSDNPYGFWIGGDSKVHKYWGGSNETVANPCDSGTVCQCDSTHNGSVVDQGFLTTKEHLPVTEVSFNATLEAGKNMSAMYSIGPLQCKNDVILSDASASMFIGKGAAMITVPLGDAPAELSFMFKTTNTNSYLIHSEVRQMNGYPDIYLAVGISGSYSMFVSLHYMGIQVERFPVSFSSPLNINNWHTVYLELNHQTLSITVDNEAFTVWTKEEFMPYLKLYPTMVLYVGGAPNGMMSYSGCIKNMRVQGRLIDLHQYAVEGSIMKGCVGLCESNPCLNGGQCIEYYTSYSCNCTNTGYTNCYCGKGQSIVISENSSVDLTTTPPTQLIGNMIYHMGFKTNATESMLLAFEETGGPNMVLSIDADGKLQGNLTSNNIVYEMMFDKIVNDEMPHYFSLMAGGTAAAPTLMLKLDKMEQTAGDFGQPFNTETVSHSLTLGETVASGETSFEGCVFLVKIGNKFLNSDITTIGTKTGQVEAGDCAPSDIPEYLIARRKGLDKLAQDSMIVSNARKPPRVEFLRVLPPSGARYDQVMDSWVVPLVQPVTLHCEVDGVPMPRIIWMKNKQALETDCYHRLNNSTLTILPLVASAGVYTCEAMNPWGTSESNEAYSLIYPSFQRVESLSTETINHDESKSLDLGCGDVTSVPPATVIWEITTGAGPSAVTQVKWPQGTLVDQRIIVSETGELTFRFVTAEDNKTKDIIFECYRVNPISGLRTKSKRYELNVKLDPSNTRMLPLFIKITPSPVILREGQDTTLRCIVQDYKAPPFETPMWYHNNMLLENNGEMLQLRNVTSGHAGIYTCKLNSTKEIKNITVQVQSVPRWSKRPELVFKYKGYDAVFSCELQVENYTTTWFSNGQPLTAKDRYTFNDDNTTLTIKNASKETDLQTISCRATQNGVTLKAEGFLSIVDSLKITTKPKDITLSIGTDRVVEFQVVVMADPVLSVTYTWLKDDAPLSNLKPGKGDLSAVITTESSNSRALLRIDTSKLTDADKDMFRGKYSCQISDSVGMMTVQSFLFIKIESDDGLSAGAIIGIVIGSVVGLTIIVGVIGYLCYNSRKANRKYGMAEGAYKNPAYAN